MSHIGTGAGVSFNPVEAAHDMNVAVALSSSDSILCLGILRSVRKVALWYLSVRSKADKTLGYLLVQ